MTRFTAALIAFVIAMAGSAPAQQPDAPDSSWVQSAQAFVPQGYVAGSVYRTNMASMTGAMAGQNASSPAAAPGRWWKVTTACAAGGDGSVRAK